jgi:hypothetical protein
LPQLLSRIPPAQVARMRRGLGCIWPRMLWLTAGLYTRAVDADPRVVAARSHDAFETTMRTLRGRLGAGAGRGAGDQWRADVSSCVTEMGDDAGFDLDALRRQVHAEASPLSRAAAHVEAIIKEWQRTRDDKTLAMKTRFFPSGIKIPGVKWT